MANAYVSHADLFDAAAVKNARAVDDALREAAPVVKLQRENITMLARYESRDHRRDETPLQALPY